jgi:hypothetical protein
MLLSPLCEFDKSSLAARCPRVQYCNVKSYREILGFYTKPIQVKVDLSYQILTSVPSDYGGLADMGCGTDLSKSFTP